jgi:hypothetical protein
MDPKDRARYLLQRGYRRKRRWRTDLLDGFLAHTA